MNKLTPTFALIIAGGLAAGIALARPGSDPAPAAANQQVAAQAGANQAPAPGGGYGGGARPATPQPANPQAGGGAAPVAAGPAAIQIQDFAYAGQTTVAPGQQIVVTNADGVAHTLTFDSGAVDTGSLAGGASVAVTAPTAPGSYSFFCTIHPSMRGELVVQS